MNEGEHSSEMQTAMTLSIVLELLCKGDDPTARCNSSLALALVFDIFTILHLQAMLLWIHKVHPLVYRLASPRGTVLVGEM